jgi:hypothetical protein
MANGLTLEQMEFLVAKGCTADEMLAFAQMSGKRSKGAERTARWRAKKNGDVTESVTCDVTRDASPPPNDIYSNPPASSDEEAKPARKPKQVLPAKPEGVKDQTWADFLDLRKRKRAPLTQTALDGISSEAGKAGWSMEAALAKCLARGWQSFEAEWVSSARAPPANDGGGSLVRSILARTAAE